MPGKQTAIITGASSGIGRAAAEGLLEAGWTVGLVARRRNILEEMANKHPEAIALPADVTDAGAVDTVVRNFADRAGRLDLLFNNAGIFTAAKPVDEVPMEDWHRAVAVNLTGMFIMARAAFAQMRRQKPQGGRIINNGSISAHAPRQESVCYTTTKHAVTGLTKSISLDGRPYDIACGQIDIGNARTDLVEGIVKAAVEKGAAPPPTMDVIHVTEALLMMAQLPLDANIQTMTIMATKMPFIGRG